MELPKFLFGDIVVVNTIEIGVIVKTWEKSLSNSFEYEVYNTMTSKIETYDESEIDRYRIRHKYLNGEDLEYQNG